MLLEKVSEMFKAIRMATKAPRISVVRMAGVIKDGKGMTNINFKNVQPSLDKAFKAKRLKAVALEINSPGGSAVQCDLIRNYVLQLKKEKKVPVTAFIEDVGTSGGYWLACCADEIYCSHSSVVGSIGAVRAGLGLVKFAKRYGLEMRVTTAGKNKWPGDPLSPETVEQRARFERLLGAIHTHFINMVIEARGNKLIADAEMKGVFEGEIWTGAEALELGLVDGISNIHRWKGEMESRANKKILLRRIKRKVGLEELLGMAMSRPGIQFPSSMSPAAMNADSVLMEEMLLADWSSIQSFTDRNCKV